MPKYVFVPKQRKMNENRVRPCQRKQCIEGKLNKKKKNNKSKME